MTVGDEHPSTATSVGNLADLLQTKGDLEAAEPLFRRELGICEAAQGDDHAEKGAAGGLA